MSACLTVGVAWTSGFLMVVGPATAANIWLPDGWWPGQELVPPPWESEKWFSHQALERKYNEQGRGESAGRTNLTLPNVIIVDRSGSSSSTLSLNY
jgi:hypothetical protein